jgi:hypothetical protein
MRVPMKPALVGAMLIAAILAGCATTGKPVAPKDGPLSAAELRTLLLGSKMSGVASDGAKWTECIQPDGATVYEVPEGAQRGRLTIQDEGRACYAYEGTGYQETTCFIIARKGATYTFDEGEGAQDSFTADSVTHGITACRFPEVGS